MRKVIAIGLVLALLAPLVRLSTPQAAASVARIDVKAKLRSLFTVSPKEVDARVDQGQAAIVAAMTRAPTLEHFTNDYSSVQPDELERELAKSRETVDNHQLIARANQGALSADEAVLFMTEVRRQMVLNNLIIRAKVAGIRERYL